MIKPILEGRRILICRPEPSASELSKVLSSVGAECVSFPTIDINFIEPSAEDRQHILNLDQYSKVIVVSQFAAQGMVELIDTYWPQAPSNQHWFGIGRKTTQVLSEYGLNVHDSERDLSSEDLLQEPALENVKGEGILIVKGKAGRSKLEQGLRDRGAKIHQIELYERRLPNYSKEQVHSALVEFQADSIIALSNDTLENLAELCTQHGLALSSIQHRHLLVPSERVAHFASALGYTKTLISTQLKPINIIQTLAKIK